MYQARYSTKRVGYEVFDAVTLAVSSQLFATEAEAQRVCDNINPPPVYAGDFFSRKASKLYSRKGDKS